MHLLLDTQAFLYWMLNTSSLSPYAQSLIQDKRNTVYVSLVSAWEISIKYGVGKLTLPSSPEVFFPQAMAQEGFVVLPIQETHVLYVHQLPLHHKDPFDRLLIAQSQIEQMPLITDDVAIRLYNVTTLW